MFRVFGSPPSSDGSCADGRQRAECRRSTGNLVYVLNTAGSSSVVGFVVAKAAYADSGLASLSQRQRRELRFARVQPGWAYLAVTERATNNLDLFRVQSDGRLSADHRDASVGPGAFSVTFAPNGAAIVSETGPGGPNSSAISSYSIGASGHLVPISASVPTLGAANCWNAVTPDGRFVYARMREPRPSRDSPSTTTARSCRSRALWWARIRRVDEPRYHGERGRQIPVLAQRRERLDRDFPHRLVRRFTDEPGRARGVAGRGRPQRDRGELII